MRVIAGSLGGRIFNSPRGHRTHPMSDKMRGAMFNMLGDISGLTVLDAFAGSGALSFEAVSRGAASAIAIERDRNAQRTLHENVALLGVTDGVKVINANANSWLRTSSELFDLILLDPPYDALQWDLLDSLSTRLQADGRLILSWPGKMEVPKIGTLVHRSAKNYGDASLHVFTV